MDISTDFAAVQRRIAEIRSELGSNEGQPFPAPISNSSSFSSIFHKHLLSGQRSPLAIGGMDAPGSGNTPNTQVDTLIEQNAATWQVDPALVRAVIANESGFNQSATSMTGAQGLMQLMPDTAKGLGVRDAYDPAQNIAAGTRYLRSLLDRFRGNERLAIAAYNAGPGAVEKYRDVPPYAETQNYVQNVLASFQKYKNEGNTMLLSNTVGLSIPSVVPPISMTIR
jgi:Transglycosylase SLT domain